MTTSGSAWQCAVCGHVHTGTEPIDNCPVCGASWDQFERIGRDESQPSGNAATNNGRAEPRTIVVIGAGGAGIAAVETLRKSSTTSSNGR